MVEFSGSVFTLIVLLVVVLGTSLGAIGFGYSRGYMIRRLRPTVLCGNCGSRIGWMRKTCARCGARLLV